MHWPAPSGADSWATEGLADPGPSAIPKIREQCGPQHSTGVPSGPLDGIVLGTGHERRHTADFVR